MGQGSGRGAGFPQDRLTTMRPQLRPRMAASPLCKVNAFTRTLEDTFINLYKAIGR